MSTEVSNRDLMIDSRDLMKFIEENGGVMEHDELLPYLDFAAEFEDYSEDYEGGATAIRYDYFADYCQDYVEGAGYITRWDELPGFLWNAIDWNAVADAMSMDYSLIEFDGVDYYVR